MPELIPILREAGYRTDTIGRHRGGQFFAAIRRLGRGTGFPLTGEVREQADAVLASLLATMEDVRFTDIAIRPFQTRQLGMTFGLIDESAPDRDDWAELYPDRLGFNPPWDGSYSTQSPTSPVWNGATAPRLTCGRCFGCT
jgi:hypothetical protein